MIHIVFQEADVSVLKKAIELDEGLQGEILEIREDFSVGPLENIAEELGYQQRMDWWKALLANSPYQDRPFPADNRDTVQQLLKTMAENPDEKVWIWMGQNPRDVCGYYWLTGQLKSQSGRILVLYLNNLPFINEKGGLFYPTTLSQILPREFLKAKKLARIITSGEFETDPDEWDKRCMENAMVRILDGGKKITGRGIDFFDQDLLSAAGKEPQKLHKVLHQFYTKATYTTGDVFLVGRIRELIRQEKIFLQGNWDDGWKEIYISAVNNTENVTAKSVDDL